RTARAPGSRVASPCSANGTVESGAPRRRGDGCRLRPVLPLAARAPGAGALADAGLAQRGPAGRAGQAAAAVDRQFLLEVAGRTVGVEEVAQGGAAAGDGVTEDLLHRL